MPYSHEPAIPTAQRAPTGESVQYPNGDIATVYAVPGEVIDLGYTSRDTDVATLTTPGAGSRAIIYTHDGALGIGSGLLVDPAGSRAYRLDPSKALQVTLNRPWQQPSGAWTKRVTRVVVLIGSDTPGHRSGQRAENSPFPALEAWLETANEQLPEE